MCGISWRPSWTVDPHRGVVGLCQVSQDVCPGRLQGFTVLVVNGKRDKRQEEVEENGDGGQGQTDCPGATAHTPHHPTERRAREGQER